MSIRKKERDLVEQHRKKKKKFKKKDANVDPKEYCKKNEKFENVAEFKTYEQFKTCMDTEKKKWLQ